MAQPRMAQTTQQLKADIDSGLTGDKVAEGFDLGLSPLGTDDEAAGTPNTVEQIAAARALEETNAPKPPPEQSAYGTKRAGPAVWVIVGALVLVLAAVGAAVWLGQI